MSSIIIQSKRVLNYSIFDAFNVVMDVKNYPSFLPYCSSVTIVSDNKNEMVADMSIQFKLFSESYRSLIRYQYSDLYAKIVITESEKNVFEDLLNIWEFRCVTTLETEVKFFLDIKPKSLLHRLTLPVTIPVLKDRIIGAFFSRLTINNSNIQ